jgi:hypothetical protein
MENQEPTNKLSAVASTALVKAISEVTSPKFDAKNPHYGNKYATLGSHIDAIKGTFAKHGWTIIQHPSSYMNSQVGITTILLHVSGDQLSFSAHIPVDPAKIDAQKAGSIYSYLRRYALSAIANLAAEDDDGQSAVETANYVSVAKPSAEAPAKPKQAPSTVPGNWRNVVLHFGKNKGQSLGSLPANSLDWYAKEWQPKPYGDKGISDADIELRNALDEYVNTRNSQGSVKPSDDVPF